MTIYELDERSYVFRRALPASRYIVSIQASNGEDKEGPWSGGEPVMTLPGGARFFNKNY